MIPIIRGALMAIITNLRVSIATLICAGSGLIFSPPAALAQCGPSGCSTPAPQVGLPAFNRPTAAQSVTLQAQVAALDARMTRMISASSPSVTPSLQGVSSAKSASKAFLEAMNARTWINGEGLWQMSPNGATCRLSSSLSSLNNSPCSSSF